MEYENCSGSKTTPVIIGGVVLLLLILVFIYFRPLERMENNPDKIITALNVTMKTGGTIVDFKRSIADPSFPPTKYIHLADMYRKGKITPASVSKVLADPNI